jgi:hypothetical protein
MASGERSSKGPELISFDHVPSVYKGMQTGGGTGFRSGL